MANGNAERVWDIIAKLLVPVVIAACGALIAHEVRLGKIEDSRFTKADSLELQRQIMSDVPEPWLRKQLDRMEMKVDRNTDRLVEIEKKIGD